MAEKINLTILGTGSAIPTANRNHPAFFLQYKSENILIDCGEGTQRQFRKAKLNPCKITRILITHWHGDHTLGLPGLLQTMSLNGFKGKLIIYGPKGTKENVKNIMDVFMKWYFSVVSKFEIEVHEVSGGRVFDEEDFYVEALELEHILPDVAYSFVFKEKNRLDKKQLEKLKIPNSPLLAELAKGKTIEFKGKKIDGKKLIYKEPSKKITFVLDTRFCENAVKISNGSDILVIESSYSANEQELAHEYTHLTSTDAANIAKKAKVDKLILTHLSQRHDMNPKLILGEAKKIFKNVVVAEDLDSFEI